ncbi:PAS domain-containing protein [Methylobacterium sp. J-068]|uniref:PAS domain-containing protein n=1 Tax=Methylobacterium sp. J-068 TaxID=2836649 RepID=UPI001FB8694F|nr:PAS domain-containing protein [Methylobacterium sp. J-068]MCJ2035187.1 PAS domain-containing protein [Methylobacterium sp. J-068]
MPFREAFLIEGGETGALLRVHDWSTSPLGLPATWPQALKTLVGVMLGSQQPMLIVWGPDYVTLYNDGYAAMCGARHPAALGGSFRDLWHDIWDQVEPILSRAYAGEATHMDGIAFIMHRNGYPEETFFSFGYTPVRDESGRVAGMFCACAETTGRLQAEREASAERRRLEQLFAQAPSFMAVLRGPEHRFELANPAYLRLVGNRPVLGRTVAEALPDAVAQGYLDLLDTVYRTGEAFTATASRLTLQAEPNGPETELYLDFVYQPIFCDNGTVTGIFVEGVDVTDRALAEIALRRNEAELRFLNADLERQVILRAHERGLTWQVSPDLLGVFHPDGYFERLNPAWEIILGWPESEIAGRPVLDLIHPDDVARSREAIAALAENRPVFRFENRYRTRDGLYRWLSWTAVPEGGRAYCSGRDITEDKAREAALDQAQEALRQAQKMEAVGQLTGGVAHDFNNLLTVIKSSTDLLKRPGLPEERRRRYVDAISDTVGRAAKLTGQLLAFARRQALKPEIFNVGTGVAAISEMVATLTGARIEIVVEVPDEPCFAHADPSQFDTALVNMAVNARDAMEGQGRLTIRVLSVEGIPPLGIPGGAFVAVALTDTGAGIAPAELHRIFEPFYTTKGVGQGTGLGLSQVFGFAKQSGGEIVVQSPPGQGATFTLYLPRVADAVPATDPIDESEPLTEGHGTCVLVVEDNPEVGGFATQTLAELGYHTVWATNAADALRQIEKIPYRFEVVFSDVVMPGMNGIELAKEIGRRRPDLPVVLASGYSHVLAEEGSHGFELLHKPYSVEQLSRVLTKAVARSRRGRRRPL